MQHAIAQTLVPRCMALATAYILNSPDQRHARMYRTLAASETVFGAEPGEEPDNQRQPCPAMNDARYQSGLRNGARLVRCDGKTAPCSGSWMAGE